MKQISVLVFAVFIMLAGCAVHEESVVSSREPKNLIIKDDYEDLKMETRKEKTVEVDYKKEGSYGQNFDPLAK